MDSTPISASGAGELAAPSNSRLWRAIFKLMFLSAPDGLISWVRRRWGMGPIEELVISGRRSGQPRPVFVAVFHVDGVMYAGHPIGAEGHWVRNLQAAGTATLIDRYDGATTVRAVRLDPGPERDLAIDQTRLQNAFPFSLVYRLERHYIDVVGEYFRLEPVQ